MGMKKKFFMTLSMAFIAVSGLFGVKQNNVESAEAADIVQSSLSYDYNIYNRYQQYWANPDIVYNESITFVQQSDGSIQARLYYEPEEIICIKDY
jgi:hypothetical protein